MKIKVTVKTQVNGRSIEKTAEAEAESDYEMRPSGAATQNFSTEEEIALSLLRALKKEWD